MPVRSLYDVLGLVGVTGRYPHRLFGVQRLRVNIGRSLMNDPAVLLVDEPTSALDTERGAAVIDLLTSLTHERGPPRCSSPTTPPTSAASTRWCRSSTGA